MKKLLLLSVVTLFSVMAANAALFEYTATMDGPSESPAVPSPRIGTAFVDYDDVAHTLKVEAIWSGLVGTTTVAHIHAPTALPLSGTVGVATTSPTFPGFPAGVTSGSYSNLFDLTQSSFYHPTFLANNGGTAAGAEAALAAAMADGKSYFNIHSSFAAGGEIRGFLVPIPEPSTFSLFAFAGVGCALLRRARRR